MTPAILEEEIRDVTVQSNYSICLFLDRYRDRIWIDRLPLRSFKCRAATHART